MPSVADRITVGEMCDLEIEPHQNLQCSEAMPTFLLIHRQNLIVGLLWFHLWVFLLPFGYSPNPHSLPPNSTALLSNYTALLSASQRLPIPSPAEVQPHSYWHLRTGTLIPLALAPTIPFQTRNETLRSADTFTTDCSCYWNLILHNGRVQKTNPSPPAL